MRYGISFLTVLLFFVWLLPLGVFIKPSQEKTACGGQRAVCLCSHIQAKVKGVPLQGYGFQKNAGTNKESNPSAGAAHSYLAAHRVLLNTLTALVLNESAFLAYLNPSTSSIEHVPKV